MKRILLIISCLQILVNICTAQISSLKYTLSPTFPTVVEGNTRVLKYLQYKSFVFLDTVDTTYICLVYDYNLTPEPYNSFVFYKKPLPYRLVMDDMEDFSHEPWYCGSYYGVGAYGKIHLSTDYSVNQRVHIFQVPEVEKLRKFTMATQMNDPYHHRMFAIGETYNSGQTQTYIMELDVQGTGISGFGPYTYAPMSEYESVDDVALVGDKVVFSTRDSSSETSKVNLRLSGVEQMLSGTEIDKQWNFLLQSEERVMGKVFVAHLNELDIGVCYIKYNRVTGKTILCVHTILNAVDFQNGVVSTISQEFVIPSGEEIVDIEYDRVEKVLIVMLDKENRQSVFVHALPYDIVSYTADGVLTNEGDRYFSIDTLETHYSFPNRGYEAWGGNKGFIQSYTTDGIIKKTCYSLIKREATIVPLKVEERDLPIDRNVGNRFYNYEELPWQSVFGLRNCYGINSKFEE